jgi:hypothetical protein
VSHVRPRPTDVDWSVLDRHVGVDQGAEVARVIALGATHIHDKDEYDMHWTTLADHEGNEFCIGTPHH